jgi:Protein of unknown function (DUF742)
VTSGDESPADDDPGDDEAWYDDDAGPLIRVFAVTRGRTRPTYPLDMVTLVMASSRVVGAPPTPEHHSILTLCRMPRSVAEVAAALKLPLVSTKVMVSDLIDTGAMTFSRAPVSAQSEDRELLRTVIDGIRRL